MVQIVSIQEKIENDYLTSGVYVPSDDLSLIWNMSHEIP